jgi:hypothetical protein
MLCAKVAAAVDTEGSLLTAFTGFRLSENSVRGLTARRAKIIASDRDGSAVYGVGLRLLHCWDRGFESR